MSNTITDRGKAAFEAMVAQSVPTYDYRALYRAKVQQQSGDKKRVDVQPVNKDLPGVNAELALFGVKVSVDVPTGTDCLLTWDGGDPRYPIALLFFASSGSKEVARKGDKTASHTHTITFVLNDSLAAPCTGSITAASVQTTIDEGSSQIKID